MSHYHLDGNWGYRDKLENFEKVWNAGISLSFKLGYETTIELWPIYLAFCMHQLFFIIARIFGLNLSFIANFWDWLSFAYISWSTNYLPKTKCHLQGISSRNIHEKFRLLVLYESETIYRRLNVFVLDPT